MAMTDKQYVDNGAKFCPFCHSNNIESKGSIEADCTVAWAYTECDDCGSSWNDQYKIVGYDVITNNVKEEPSIEVLLDEVIDDAVDTCVNDTGYLRSLLRDFYSTMSYDEIRKLHNDAFDNDE